MEIFIMIIIFIIGTVLGSFFTLAVYRIPKKENIVYKHSYCPNCHHKLGFFDMIPIFSFLALKGKCRYCKQKIRIRYLCLEIISGICLLLFYRALNVNLYHIEISKMIYFVSTTIFLSTMILIGGIDKENRSISKAVLVFGILVQIIYAIYQYIWQESDITRYIYLLIIEAIFFMIENRILKNKAQKTYPLEILELYIYIGFVIPNPFDIGILMTITLISTALYLIIEKLKKCNEETDILAEKQLKTGETPIGFLTSIFTVVIVIVNTYLMYQ